MRGTGNRKLVLVAVMAAPSNILVRLRLHFDYPPPAAPDCRLCWLLVDLKECRVVADVESLIRDKFGFSSRRSGSVLRLFVDGCYLPHTESALLLRDNDTVRVKVDCVAEVNDSSKRKRRRAVEEVEVEEEEGENGVSVEWKKKKRKKNRVEEPSVTQPSGDEEKKKKKKKRKKSKEACLTVTLTPVTCKKTKKTPTRVEPPPKIHKKPKPPPKAGTASDSSSSSDDEDEAPKKTPKSAAPKPAPPPSSSSAAPKTPPPPKPQQAKPRPPPSSDSSSSDEDEAPKKTAAPKPAPPPSSSSAAPKTPPPPKPQQAKPRPPPSSSSDSSSSSSDEAPPKNTTSTTTPKGRPSKSQQAPPKTNTTTSTPKGSTSDSRQAPPTQKRAADVATPPQGDGGDSDSDGEIKLVIRKPVQPPFLGGGAPWRGRGRGQAWRGGQGGGGGAREGRGGGRGGVQSGCNGAKEPTSQTDTLTNVSVIHQNGGGVATQRDYQAMPLLAAPPQAGQRIAFKLLELTENYTPEVSEYKEGKILSCDFMTKQIELELLTASTAPVEPGKFDLVYQNADGSESVEYAVSRGSRLTERWESLLEPRLII